MGKGRWVGALVVCGTVALLVVGFYLSVYSVRGYDQPLGYDTARYLWRTNCVAAGGLSELRRCASTPAALPSRVGYPLVSILLSTFLRVSRYRLAAVIPTVAASAIALAGAALIGWAVRLDAKRFALMAVIVGVSPMVVAMADPEGYADTMLALAVGIAALLAVSVVAERGRGYLSAMILLTIATVVHAPTGTFLGIVVAATAVVYAPAALAASREGGWRGSVAIRMTAVLGGAVAVWAAVLVVAVRARPDPYRAPIADLEEKLHSHWPRLGFPVGVPAAAAGAVVLARSASPVTGEWPRRRFLLTLLLSWLGVIGTAVIVWFAGWKLPVHRFLLLSVPLPLLGGLALLWLAGRAEARRRTLGTMVLAAGCLAVLAAGYALWARNAPPVLRSARLDVARAAVEYVRGLPDGTAVSVVTDTADANPDALAQTFRAVLPEGRIRDVTFTSRPSGTGGVVLALKGYSGSFDSLHSVMPEREVAPGVIVSNGAVPTRALDPPRGTRLGAGAVVLVGIGLAAVLLLGTVGLGWSQAAFGSLRPLERAAVAPGVGLAVLVVDGLIVDAAGARIGGPIGVLAVLGTGLLGAALALRHRLPLPAGADRRRDDAGGRER